MGIDLCRWVRLACGPLVGVSRLGWVVMDGRGCNNCKPEPCLSPSRALLRPAVQTARLSQGGSCRRAHTCMSTLSTTSALAIEPLPLHPLS